MMSELVRELKLQNAYEKLFKGLESDTYADYSFIFGDLNYRINSTYMYLSRHLEECKDMNTEQLTIAMHNGYYPGYVEPTMDWMPTYKLSFTDNSYVDKKDQAPSYTDRILFRNNTTQKVDLKYSCLYNVIGSDHRPVVMDLVFKG